jgi:hypothetical protein
MQLLFCLRDFLLEITNPWIASSFRSVLKLVHRAQGTCKTGMFRNHEGRQYDLHTGRLSLKQAVEAHSVVRRRFFRQSARRWLWGQHYASAVRPLPPGRFLVLISVKKTTRGFEPISYRGAVLRTPLHAILYVVYTICWMYWYSLQGKWDYKKNSVRGWVDPQRHSAAGRIRPIEKFSDIGNRTRDLPAW